MKFPLSLRGGWAAISLTLATAIAPVVSAETLVVYSARNEQLVKPIFEAMVNSFKLG